MKCALLYSIFTCGEVNEGLRWFWRCSDAHGLPDAIDAADITWSHLSRQLRQVASHLLRCRHKQSKRNINTRNYTRLLIPWKSGSIFALLLSLSFWMTLKVCGLHMRKIFRYQYKPNFWTFKVLFKDGCLAKMRLDNTEHFLKLLHWNIYGANVSSCSSQRRLAGLRSIVWVDRK